MNKSLVNFLSLLIVFTCEAALGLEVHVLDQAVLSQARSCIVTASPYCGEKITIACGNKVVAELEQCSAYSGNSRKRRDAELSWATTKDFIRSNGFKIDQDLYLNSKALRYGAAYRVMTVTKD